MTGERRKEDVEGRAAANLSRNVDPAVVLFDDAKDSSVVDGR
jgi:hypothetical protein